MTATSGPGISLMTEFIGLAYFAEIPVVIFDIQRMGPSHRPADPHRAGGHRLRRRPVARRLPAHPPAAGLGRRVLRDGVEAPSTWPSASRRPIFVVSDLDLGMNIWMSDPFAYPDEAARSRQGARRRDAGAARRLGPLQGRRRRRHSATARCPAPSMPAYFTRGTGHNEKARYSERPDDFVNNLDRLARKFETARDARARGRSSRRARRQGRPHRLRHDALGDRGEPRPAGARGRARDRLPAACARFRSTTAVGAFIDAHERVYVIEQNRDAPDARPAAAGAERRSRSASCASVLHYNGLPIDARTLTADILAQEGPHPGRPRRRARSRRRPRRRVGQGHRHGRRHPASQEDQPHRPRARHLPRQQDHAVRRLRPQRHHRAHHRGVLRAGHRSEAGHQALRHRLLEQDAGLLPRRLARLQRRARPHAVGGDRRAAGQRSRCWASASAATATPAPSASASSCT